MQKLIIIVMALLSLNNYADIFGKDDRFNISRGSIDTFLAKSVAVGVPFTLWDEVNHQYKSLLTDEASSFLCRDERFYKEEIVPYACSGFLVGDDLLVTAGHCSTNGQEIRSSSDMYCESYTWMFDYYHTTNTKRILQRNIYKCKEIIYAIESDEGDRYYDFALIRLDRKVTGRKPLKMSMSKVKKGDAVKMYGHPMGMPMKVAKNAQVIEGMLHSTFKTNLDAFAGNSGSPVLNMRNEVVGVLVAGNPNNSTYRDEELGCDRYNYCDENGANCKINGFDPEGVLSFPDTFSEVQSIELYRSLIEKHL